jgi:hypothetical protein
MVDPKKALESMRRYYETVTPEQFLEDWRRAAPQGTSLHEEWVAAGIEKKPEEHGVESITLSLRAQTLELFERLEKELDYPGAMAYFRDGLWLAALARSQDQHGRPVKLSVEYLDSNKESVIIDILKEYRLCSLRKLLPVGPVQSSS